MAAAGTDNVSYCIMCQKYSLIITHAVVNLPKRQLMRICAGGCVQNDVQDLWNSQRSSACPLRCVRREMDLKIAVRKLKEYT